MESSGGAVVLEASKRGSERNAAAKNPAGQGIEIRSEVGGAVARIDFENMRSMRADRAFAPFHGARKCAGRYAYTREEYGWWRVLGEQEVVIGKTVGR